MTGEPCACGDPYCGNCGPLQGNYRCEVCGRWTMDGGCLNPLACTDSYVRLVEAEYDHWVAAERERSTRIEEAE